MSYLFYYHETMPETLLPPLGWGVIYVRLSYHSTKHYHLFWKGDNVVSVLWSFYHINASIFFRRRVSNVVYVRSSQDHISRHYLLLWKGRGSVVYVCLLYILTKICSLWLYIFSSINNNSWPPYSLKRQWISPVRIAVLVIVKQELHTL